MRDSAVTTTMLANLSIGKRVSFIVSHVAYSNSRGRQVMQDIKSQIADVRSRIAELLVRL